MPLDAVETPKPNAIGTLRDLKRAALVGAATEAILAWFAFEAGSELVAKHPWLEISQMPGAQIAELLFHHIGVAQSLTFAIAFQGAGFMIIALGILYAYRLVQAKAHRP
jgi:hypothetical protein